jgi:TfoX/Sxy family transcriptional regulator of competence genes
LITNVEREPRQGQGEPGPQQRCKTAQEGPERGNVICPADWARAILSGEAHGEEATGRHIMYDPGLAARLDDIMAGMLEMEVTRMFGGYGFLMNGHMCLGVWDDRLVIRIGTDGWNAICDQPHVGPMDFTGKVMKGWAMIHPDGLSEDEDLQRYVDMAIMFCAALPPKQGR